MADNYNTSGSASSSNPLNAPATDRSTTGDVVGETTGGLAGAATGAALGSLGGPLGTIIGGIAGAAGGWWSGRAVSQAASSFDNDDTYYQDQYRASSGTTGSSSSMGGSTSYDTARPAYQLGHVAGMNPDYQGRSFDDVETDLRKGYDNYNASDAKAPAWNDVRGYARDAYARGQERRLTLAEEQLAVGKRQVQAGEVNIRKTVDTEHVQQQVGLSRDEVSIERRPLSAADAADLTIGEETIRVPLTREEAVVEKRVVPTEEVLVRTNQVTDQQTVEADLRKERLVTEGLDQTTGYAADRTATDADLTSGTTTRTHESLTDRVKDAARDLKNDVTGR